MLRELLEKTKCYWHSTDASGALSILKDGYIRPFLKENAVRTIPQLSACHTQDAISLFDLYSSPPHVSDHFHKAQLFFQPKRILFRLNRNLPDERLIRYPQTRNLAREFKDAKDPIPYIEIFHKGILPTSFVHSVIIIRDRAGVISNFTLSDATLETELTSLLFAV